MTNIESLALSARSVRWRQQTTFSTASDFAAASLDAYFGSRLPEPALGDCQAYTESELLPVPPDAMGEQVIEFEKSSPTEDLIRSLRQLKKSYKDIREGSKNALRRKFKELLRKHTITYLRPSVVRTKVYLPLKYRRVRDGLREIRVRIMLKPRQIVKWVIVGFINTGEYSRPKWATRPVWVTPHVWRTLIVPKYRKVVIRPAGFYLRKVRKLIKATRVDWDSLRAEYASYKVMVKKLHYEALSLNRAQQAVIYKQLGDRPKLMRTNTTMGSTILTPSIPEHTVRGTDYPLDFFTTNSASHLGVHIHAYQYVSAPTLDSLRQQQRRLEIDHGVYSGSRYLDYVVPVRKQGSIRVYKDAEQSYATEGSDERLAYSNVAALTKANDYTFQWFRSLLELKDLDGVAHSALRAPGFFKALCQKKFSPSKFVGRVKALRALDTLPVLKGLIGAYLLWKFGVQPTIEDISTLERESLEWVFSLRRSLTAVLDRLQDQGNIFHARAKFGANSRILKLGAYLPVENEHKTLKASVVQIIRLPQLITVEPEATVTVVEGDPDVEHYSVRSLSSDYRDLVYDGSLNEAYITSETRQAPTHVGVEWPGSVIHQVWNDGYWITYGSESLGSPVVINAGTEIASPDRGYEPTVHLPVYAWNHLSGCIFASYCMGEVAQLSSEFRSFVEKLRELVGGSVEMEEYLTQVLPHAEKHLDRTFVAWELTPLSFVYDWFTDSHTIVSTLANLARKNEDTRIPEPLHGIWESKRCELLTGTVKCKLASLRVSEFVREWHTVRVDHRNGSHYIASPAVISRRYEYVYEHTDDKVHIERSGLYRVRRGEHLGYADIFAFAPRLKPNLDIGKLTTLSALLAQFTAPKEG